MSDLNDLAEYLKKTLANMPPWVPGTIAVCAHNDSLAVEIYFADEPSYGDPIKGEGADICLYRSQETNQIIGCRLPLPVKCVRVVTDILD